MFIYNRNKTLQFNPFARIAYSIRVKGHSVKETSLCPSPTSNVLEVVAIAKAIITEPHQGIWLDCNAEIKGSLFDDLKGNTRNTETISPGKYLDMEISWISLPKTSYILSLSKVGLRNSKNCKSCISEWGQVVKCCYGWSCTSSVSKKSPWQRNVYSTTFTTSKSFNRLLARIIRT